MKTQYEEEDEVRDAPASELPLTLTAMKKIAADIKGTLFSAITELKADVLSLPEKMEGVEMAGLRRDKAIPRLDKITDSLGTSH